MRIVFMGTPGFASVSLERLYKDGHDVVGVFTQPDKPRNRGMKVSFSPVKEVALAHGSKVYQPISIRDGMAANIIRELNCEIIFVVAYGKLLPVEILNLPLYGCINIHASLLPKYRGAAPIQWAILKGETETGVTSIYMAEELDAGDVIFSKRLSIGDDETAGELHERLSIAGAELLCETLDAVSKGKAIRVPQNHSEASFAPPLSKDISPIDWTDTALNIKCKIRGLNPWPVATAQLGGEIFKVFSADISNSSATNKKPGEIVTTGHHGIEIACADATVIIKELQASGGKRMKAGEYLKGHSDLIGN